MKSNIKISFWLNSAKTNKNRFAPIYVRVTDGQDYFTMTTGKYIKPSDWNKKTMKLKGISDEINSINEFLNAFRTKIQRIASQLMLKDESFNVFTIKDMISDNGKNQIKVIEYFKSTMFEMKTLEGNDYAKPTIIKYTNTMNRLEEFIQMKFKRGDIYMYELCSGFMDEFITFLKAKFTNSQTTCYKHFQRFSKVIRYAYKKGMIDKYPFLDYSIRLPKKQVEFLTQEEINRIDDAVVHGERLEKIKDVFIFCCYSGLAYCEVLNLKPVNIILGLDNKRWVYIERQKTGKNFQAPLLPRAEEILDKYWNGNSDKGIFPVPSNVKFNAYLKEIGDIAKVDKVLTTHLARKSFSVSVMLTNGVSIGVLSKCLGHSSIQVTLDCYSKIVDRRIIDEIVTLRGKLKRI